MAFDMPPPPRSKIWMSDREKKDAISNIKRGGRIADHIRKEAEIQYKTKELPDAEKRFAKEIANAYPPQKTEILPNKETIIHQSFWVRIINFLTGKGY